MYVNFVTKPENIHFDFTETSQNSVLYKYSCNAGPGWLMHIMIVFGGLSGVVISLIWTPPSKTQQKLRLAACVFNMVCLLQISQ